MEDARGPTRQCGGVLAVEAFPRRLDPDESDSWLADEPGEQTDGVGATTDTRDGDVRQPSLDLAHLGRGLVPDDPLEVAHEGRVRVRPDRRAEHVVGRGPAFVTQSRIASLMASLSVALPEVHLAVLGAQGTHPEHVGRLSPDVLRAHVHDAFEVEERTRGRGRHAVLAGAGLGDDPRLAQPSGEQCLAERIVDLVGARVIKVLALEVQPQVARCPACPPLSSAASRSARYNPLGRPMNPWPSSRNSAQNAGSVRIDSYACSSAMRAAIRVSGTYRPPNWRWRPHRPWASGSTSPGFTGRGPNGNEGMSRRAARARLVNKATRMGSLGGRPGCGG